MWLCSSRLAALVWQPAASSANTWVCKVLSAKLGEIPPSRAHNTTASYFARELALRVVVAFNAHIRFAASLSQHSVP